MFKFFVIMIFTCDMKMTKEIRMQAKMLTTTTRNKACANSVLSLSNLLRKNRMQHINNVSSIPSSFSCFSLASSNRLKFIKTMFANIFSNCWQTVQMVHPSEFLLLFQKERVRRVFLKNEDIISIPGGTIYALLKVCTLAFELSK